MVDIPEINKKKTLFVAISGADSFGWKKPDSDLDLIYVKFSDLSKVISPFFSPRTTQRITGKLDEHFYPVEKYLGLLVEGNCNVLDNLFEPKLYQRTRLVKSLQKIVINNLHVGFIDHCLGYSKHLKKDLSNPVRIAKYGKPKLLLNRYRIVLQGFTLTSLGYNRIQYNLRDLLRNSVMQVSHGESLLDSYLHHSSEKYYRLLIPKAEEEVEMLDRILQSYRSNEHFNQYHNFVSRDKMKVALKEWYYNIYRKKWI